MSETVTGDGICLVCGSRVGSGEICAVCLMQRGLERGSSRPAASDAGVEEEAKLLLAKVTPGEWHAPGLGEVHSDHDRDVFVRVLTDGDLDPVVCDYCTPENAAFIAAAPRLVRDLLAAYDRIQQERDEWEALSRRQAQRQDSLRQRLRAVEAERDELKKVMFENAQAAFVDARAYLKEDRSEARRATREAAASPPAPDPALVDCQRCGHERHEGGECGGEDDMDREMMCPCPGDNDLRTPAPTPDETGD